METFVLVLFPSLYFKTLEEFYYISMGIQYPITPLLITEHRWHIAGIVTPAIVMLTTLLARGNLSVHLYVHILWKEDGSPPPSVHVSPRYLSYLLCVASGTLSGRS